MGTFKVAMILAGYVYGAWRTHRIASEEPIPPGAERIAAVADALIAVLWPLYWGYAILANLLYGPAGYRKGR